MLLPIVATVLVAQPSQAGKIHVETTEPNHPTACTLVDAVVAADSRQDVGNCDWTNKSVVKLDNGLTYLLPTQIPKILRSVTVEGEWSVENRPVIAFAATAPANRRFFEIAGSGRLTLSHLVLENGNRTTAHGGAISVKTGGRLTAGNVTFRNNHAGTNQGGAIYNLGTTQLDSVTFEGNTARFGGAVSNAGAGALEAKASLFDGNGASKGGAIFQWASGGSIEAKNSTFSDNQAAFGGALYTQAGLSEIDLSTFRNNASIYDFDGGTLYAQSPGLINLRRSAITADIGQGALCQGASLMSSSGNNATSDNSCELDGLDDQVTWIPIPMSELVYHGGMTKAHVPLCEWTPTGDCGSPLVDQYECCAFGEPGCEGEELLFDARAQFSRRSLPNLGWSFDGGGECDIGAYESICEDSTSTGTTDTIRLHEFQVVSEAQPVLLDNGACFSHSVGFDPEETNCRIQWHVFGAQLRIKSVLFLTLGCTETCFPDATACATQCPGTPPAGWLEDTNASVGTVAFNVPTCNKPAEARRYVLELYNISNPGITWWWDPRTPVEVEI